MEGMAWELLGVEHKESFTLCSAKEVTETPGSSDSTLLGCLPALHLAYSTLYAHSPSSTKHRTILTRIRSSQEIRGIPADLEPRCFKPLQSLQTFQGNREVAVPEASTTD